MIIDAITLRIKNIIFFKIVCLIIGYGIISYFVSSSSEQLTNSKIKLVKANILLKETNDRYVALSSQNKNLQDVVKQYQDLKQQSNNYNENCFDKNKFQQKITEAEKIIGLAQPSALFISSSSTHLKDQPKQTITVKNILVKANYQSEDYIKALGFAKLALEALPEFSSMREFKIKKYNVITPNMSSWLQNSDDNNLILADITFDINEIELNG